MTDEEIEKIAGAVADKLQGGLLRIPTEITKFLKDYAGNYSMSPIDPSPNGMLIAAQILVDGAIHLELLTSNRMRVWEATLDSDRYIVT